MKQQMEWKEIPITQIQGIRIGNAQNEEAMTGVTVVLFDRQNAGGVDISGGGPASRETGLLSPLSNPNSLNALVFSGGSAFGLDAAAGVMRYLEEHGMGYHVLNTVVPLVCQSCIFDLGLGSGSIRPDAAMGYAACVDAQRNQPRSGSVGAGTGAAAGKVNGIAQGEKSGIGYAALEVNGLQVGAMVVANPFGDVFDHRTGQKLAGMRTPDRSAYASAAQALYAQQGQQPLGANTTLGAVFTNAAFSQAEMNKIASMARAAFGRCIDPVGTMIDGDTIYAFSLGEVQADISAVGALAAEVLCLAIEDAARSSKLEDEVFLKLIGSKSE